MSFAGRAASSSGRVGRPKGRGTGLTGYAASIRCSSLTGSYAMETAEHREPYESRGSRTVLGAPGGEIPPGDSPDWESVTMPRVRFTPIATDYAPRCFVRFRKVGRGTRVTDMGAERSLIVR